MGRINRRLRGSVLTPIIGAPADYQLSDFGQQMIVQPRRIFDLTQVDEINTDLCSTDVVGGASVTHKPLTSSAQLAVTGAAGDRARFRTVYHWYTAGAAQRILQTGWAQKVAQVNQRIRIGYFDDDNGVFFEVRSTGTYVVRRTKTSGAVVETEQLSSMTLQQWLYHTIFELRFRYLGHGPLRCYINTQHCRTWEFEPEIGPFMSVARLPLSVEIENTGASVANTFDFQCAAVESWGGGAETTPRRTFGDTIAVAAIPAAETAILAWRMAATYGGITNRGQMHPHFLTLGAETQRIRFTLRWKPTLLLPDAAWTAVSAQSRVERRSLLTGLNAPSALGTALASFLVVSGGTPAPIDISDVFHISGRRVQLDPLTNAPTILMLTAANEGPGTADSIGGITFSEHP